MNRLQKFHDKYFLGFFYAYFGGRLCKWLLNIVRRPKMKISKEELIDRLDTMLIRACADLGEYESSQISEEIKKNIGQAYKQIRQLIENQPEVDEEFVEKWAKNFFYADWYRSNEYGKDFLKDEIKRLLTEAGVKIKGGKQMKEGKK